MVDDLHKAILESFREVLSKDKRLTFKLENKSPLFGWVLSVIHEEVAAGVYPRHSGTATIMIMDEIVEMRFKRLFTFELADEKVYDHVTSTILECFEKHSSAKS